MTTSTSRPWSHFHRLYLANNISLQEVLNIKVYSILLVLYSVQHWRSKATCAAALELPNLNYVHGQKYLRPSLVYSLFPVTARINFYGASPNVTGPAKIGHVGSQNSTTFQTFGSHNFLFQYGMATKISEMVDNLFGFTTLLTESKY